MRGTVKTYLLAVVLASMAMIVVTQEVPEYMGEEFSLDAFPDDDIEYSGANPSLNAAELEYGGQADNGSDDMLMTNQLQDSPQEEPQSNDQPQEEQPFEQPQEEMLEFQQPQENQEVDPTANMDQVQGNDENEPSTTIPQDQIQEMEQPQGAQQMIPAQFEGMPGLSNLPDFPTNNPN